MRSEKGIKTKLNPTDNEIVFSLNTKIYPQEAIYKTCYVFIDKMYIYLDSPKKGEIIASLKSKLSGRLSAEELEKIKGEFLNELLNILLRNGVIKKNQKIMEYIVSGVVNASLEEKNENKTMQRDDEDDTIDIEKEIASLKEELDKIEEKNFEDDPLGIRGVVNN